MQLVHETLFDRLADDVPTAHDHDVTIGGGGPSLVDCSRQIVDEGESHAQLPFQPNVMRRRVGDDEERKRPCRLGAVRHVLGPDVGRVDDVEQPPTHHHGTGRRSRPFEDLGVDRVLFHDPGLELVDVSDPPLGIGARRRDVASIRLRSTARRARRRATEDGAA